MAVALLGGAKIAGVVTALPDRIIQTAHGMGKFGPSDAGKVIQMTGVQQLHLAKSGQTSVDFCASAAVRLFQLLDWDPQSVGAILFVTQTPDYRMPGSAHVLHGRLGLKTGCMAIDLPMGCSGYVYGLWFATQLVHTGTAKRVLLVNGDTLSRYISPKDRSTVFLFGDGGAATAIEADPNGGKQTFVLGSDGTGVEKLYIPAGGEREPASSATKEYEFLDTTKTSTREQLHMDGLDVFNFSCRILPDLIKETLQAQEWSVEEVDLLLMHQASRFILDFLIRKLKLPSEKVPMNIQRYGNTSSVTIPLLLTDFFGKSVGTANCDREYKMMFTGFGIGYSWASAAMKITAMPTDMIYV